MSNCELLSCEPLSNSKIAPALCPCGHKNCPNPGVRNVARPVKGRATSIIPLGSGPRYKGR